MLSVEDFVSKYEEYTDEELFEVYENISTYSKQAQDALSIVISSKGGQEKTTTTFRRKEQSRKRDSKNQE
jgi:hypothetical protein